MQREQSYSVMLNHILANSFVDERYREKLPEDVFTMLNDQTAWQCSLDLASTPFRNPFEGIDLKNPSLSPQEFAGILSKYIACEIRRGSDEKDCVVILSSKDPKAEFQGKGHLNNLVERLQSHNPDIELIVDFNRQILEPGHGAYFNPHAKPNPRIIIPTSALAWSMLPANERLSSEYRNPSRSYFHEIRHFLLREPNKTMDLQPDLFNFRNYCPEMDSSVRSLEKVIQPEGFGLDEITNRLYEAKYDMNRADSFFIQQGMSRMTLAGKALQYLSQVNNFLKHKNFSASVIDFRGSRGSTKALRIIPKIPFKTQLLKRKGDYTILPCILVPLPIDQCGNDAHLPIAELSALAVDRLRKWHSSRNNAAETLCQIDDPRKAKTVSIPMNF
jgi:hypothetical protein